MKKLYVMLAIIAMTVLLVLPASDAFARAGGGGFRGSSGGFRGSSGSYGSRGSRTYSTPANPSRSFNSNSNTGATAPTPYVAPSYPQNTGGGFMRGLMGGLVGGMLGSLLFSRLGFAGIGNTGGLFGGIGVFEIIIIGLGIYLLFKFMKSRRQEAAPAYYNAPNNAGQYRQEPLQYAPASAPMTDTSDNGLSGIKQLDPNFSESAFKEEAGDIFFKVQAAWTNRDLSPVRALLAGEISSNMHSDIDKLKQEGRVNRLENIAMREVAVTEAWTEQGVSYITVRLTASVLDYVTDEAGKLIEGSKTEPVKFVEYWTYSRPIGQSRWQLSAIQQES